MQFVQLGDCTATLERQETDQLIEKNKAKTKNITCPHSSV